MTDETRLPEQLTHPKYRTDIDGLRAIAVLSVMIFHAFPTALRGGFIGVDIFFVISGYLISTIIFGSFARNKFSFGEFYTRRIRRIFPALLIVLASSLFIGWFTLLAFEYQQLGKHVTGGAAFISNFVLWNESGYFDKAADTKPLLHLWSLGIEEQFYIFWPLVIWGAWRKKWNLLYISTALALISFGLNIATVDVYPTGTYYSPTTRIWEIMCGSILASLTLKNPRILKHALRSLEIWSLNLQSFLGGLLLVVGLLLTNETRSFPGWWALIPVLGAVLILDAGSDAWLNRKILSAKALVWVGLISFPLYLWHWVLISFTRILSNGAPSTEIRGFMVAFSILLATLTYQVIEKRVRSSKSTGLQTFSFVGIMILLACVGMLLRSGNGLPDRRVVVTNPKISGDDGGDQHNLAAGCGVDDPEQRSLFANCVHDLREEPVYALLGDSKATALSTGLVRTSLPHGRWLFIGGNGPHDAPVPVLSDYPLYKLHQSLLRAAISAINSNPHIKTVAIVAATRTVFKLKGADSIEDLPQSPNYQIALTGLDKTVKSFVDAGKSVVLVVDNPTLPDPNDCLERTTGYALLDRYLKRTPNPKCELEISKHLELSGLYRKLLWQVEQDNHGHVQLFDTVKYLCDLSRGVCGPQKNGRLLYSYGDHISDHASGIIGQDLNRLLNSKP